MVIHQGRPDPLGVALSAEQDQPGPPRGVSALRGFDGWLTLKPNVHSAEGVWGLPGDLVECHKTTWLREQDPAARGVIMSQTIEYPPVTDELLNEVVRRVLEVGSPRKIVLFGSRARGDARPDSDLDLLILEDSELPRYRRSPRYYHALTGLFPAKDIVVYTPEEVRKWADVPNAFVTAALREGRVLYGDTD